MRGWSTTFVIVLLGFASILPGGLAKKYYNHQIATDKTGLLGRNVHHTYDNPNVPEDEEDQHRRRLRTDEKSGEPPMGSMDSEDFDPEDSPFYRAESLDFFKKGIDPELFEWVNPDKIVPGGYTCGFLKPPLGSLDDVNYPTIEVYVCMKFADTQPAKKGNVFVHCGGPGSLSSCLFTIPISMGTQNNNDYNFLAIDQRGMGRSWPNFAHDECSENSFVRADNGTIIETVKPEEHFVGNSSEVPNVSNEDEIRAWLAPLQRRVQDCWTCEECDFFFEEEQDDGNVTSFHFLEFSGTRQLAEDIFRMRLLLNAPVMHVYGVSYGTGVFGTYATVFPSFTGLFVLDSNISPNPDHYYQASTGAIGFNERIDYVIFSCTARNIQNPGSCPVEDMRKCMGDIASSLADVGFGPGVESSGILQVFLVILFQHPDRAQEICDAAEEGDTDRLEELALELQPENPTLEPVTTRQDDDLDLASFPTFNDLIPVYDNPDYQIIDKGLQVSIAMVRAQDRAGPIYDEDRFVEEVMEINERYTGAGTGFPGGYFFFEYSIGYYWPKAVPLPPIGNSFITGIVAGSLYDSNTPYSWTQEMRNAFKSSSLLTDQGIKHGIIGFDPDCQRHVNSYFENGYVGFVDGQICGADFADQDALSCVFGIGEGCGFKRRDRRGRRRTRTAFVPVK